MTKDEMLALVQRQVDTYNSLDVDGFCSCYHPEVKVEHLISGNPPTSGMEVFRQRYTSLFQKNKALHCEIKNRIVLNGSVIDEEWVTGAEAYPNGLHAAAVYGFRDGLIDRVWFAR